MDKDIIKSKLSDLREMLVDIDMDPEDREGIDQIISDIEDELKK